MANKLKLLKLSLVLPLFLGAFCSCSSNNQDEDTEENYYVESSEESEYFEIYVKSFAYYNGQTYTFVRSSSNDIRIDNIKYYAYTTSSIPNGWPSRIAYLLDIADVTTTTSRTIYTSNNGNPLKVSGGTIVSITVGRGE